MIKIVYLHTEFMPYQVPIILELVNNYNSQIELFHYAGKTKHPYKPKPIPNVNFHNRFDYNYENLSKFILDFNPDFIIIAGYVDKLYLKITSRLRKEKNIPVISGTDSQYLKTFRQKIACIISKWYIKPSISHFWVAGEYQFEYVKRLGYPNDKIVFNFLSADVEKFHNVNHVIKESEYPHNFLFIGRLNSTKGINHLIDAWVKLTDKKGWTLTLIGNGDLKERAMNAGIVVKDFMDQDNLVKEMQNSGCFILPSVFEPWALVIHEAASAALPIIATDVCGAVPHFLINQYNGLIIKSNQSEAIKLAMETIISMPNEILFLMGQRSRFLSKKITPEISAASLMSAING